jgi:hypothetical protein
VRVVRKDNSPTLATGVREQLLKGRDDHLRARIRERAVNEVVEHVDDDESFHGRLLVPFSIYASTCTQAATSPESGLSRIVGKHPRDQRATGARRELRRTDPVFPGCPAPP